MRLLRSTYLLRSNVFCLFVCLFVCFGGRGALLTALKVLSLDNSKFEYSNCGVQYFLAMSLLIFTPIEKNSSRGIDNKDRGRRPIFVFKTEAQFLSAASMKLLTLCHHLSFTGVFRLGRQFSC